MSLEMDQANASHVLLDSIVPSDQYCLQNALLVATAQENQISLINALSENMVTLPNFNLVMNVQHVLLENTARMVSYQEIVQWDSTVIRAPTLKTKIKSFVPQDTIALQVQFIPQFAQLERQHSREVPKM